MQEARPIPVAGRFVEGCVPCGDGRPSDAIRGLGDLLKKTFEFLGIPACEACRERARRLNELVSFAGPGGAAGGAGDGIGDDKFDLHENEPGYRFDDSTGRWVPICPNGMTWDDAAKECVHHCPPAQHYDVFKEECRPNCQLGEVWDETLSPPRCVPGKHGSFALVYEPTDKPGNFGPAVPGFAQFVQLKRRNSGGGKIVAWFAIVTQAKAVGKGLIPGSMFRPTPCEAYIDDMEDLHAVTIALAGCDLPEFRAPRSYPYDESPRVDDDLQFVFYPPNARQQPIATLTGADVNRGGNLVRIDAFDAAGIWSVEVSRGDGSAMPIASRVFPWHGSGEAVVAGDGPNLKKGGLMSVSVTGTKSGGPGSCPPPPPASFDLQTKDSKGQWHSVDCVMAPATVKVTPTLDLKDFPGVTPLFSWGQSPQYTISGRSDGASVVVNVNTQNAMVGCVVTLGSCVYVYSVPTCLVAVPPPPPCPSLDAGQTSVSVVGCIDAQHKTVTVKVDVVTNPASPVPKGTYKFEFRGRSGENKTVTTQDNPSATATFSSAGAKSVTITLTPSVPCAPPPLPLTRTFTVTACPVAPNCEWWNVVCGGCALLGVILAASIFGVIVGIAYTGITGLAAAIKTAGDLSLTGILTLIGVLTGSAGLILYMAKCKACNLAWAIGAGLALAAVFIGGASAISAPPPHLWEAIGVGAVYALALAAAIVACNME